jgi:hypothetical protein
MSTGWEGRRLMSADSEDRELVSAGWEGRRLVSVDSGGRGAVKAASGGTGLGLLLSSGSDWDFGIGFCFWRSRQRRACSLRAASPFWLARYRCCAFLCDQRRAACRQASLQ